MRQWWQQLALRDRQALLIAALALLAGVAWLGLWEPLQKDLAALEQAIQVQQQAYEEMHNMAVQIQALGGQADVGQKPALSGKLLSMVDARLRQGGLSKMLKRMEPYQGDKVRVRLEAVALDRLLSWLENAQSAGIEVSEISARARKQPGLADVRMVLVERPS